MVVSRKANENFMQSSYPNSGTYMLLIRLLHDSSIEIGGLGRVQFRLGYYLYTGSALRGLWARIHRHYSKQKKRRWHIDYLTCHDHCEVEQVAVVFGIQRLECALNRALAEGIEEAETVRRFGSSDCKNGCGGHLIRIPNSGCIAKVRSILMMKEAHWFTAGIW
jgi:Uri superfamily endonuclease